MFNPTPSLQLPVINTLLSCSISCSFTTCNLQFLSFSTTSFLIPWLLCASLFMSYLDPFVLHLLCLLDYKVTSIHHHFRYLVPLLYHLQPSIHSFPTPVLFDTTHLLPSPVFNHFFNSVPAQAFSTTHYLLYHFSQPRPSIQTTSWIPLPVFSSSLLCNVIHLRPGCWNDQISMQQLATPVPWAPFGWFAALYKQWLIDTKQF